MGLYKQKGSNNWWCKFSVKGYDQNPVRESTGTADKAQAGQYEAKRKQEIWEHVRLSVKPDHTWDEAVIEYLIVMPEGTTKRNIRYMLRWLGGHLEGKKLGEIDRELLAKIRAAKIAEINARKAKQAERGAPSRWRSAQPSTINRMLCVVQAVVNYTIELGWRDAVLKAPMLEVKEKEKPWASREKTLKLIMALPRHHIPMVLFALEVGWRRRNVTHLEWSQVDLERRFAWITPEAAKAGKGIPAPLSDTAMEVLRAQVGKHERWVFPYRGKAVEQTSTRAFRRARDTAGLPPEFTWHSLRHTWASWNRQDGTPLHVLKELGGWRTDKMVAHYAHLGGDHLRPYVDARVALAGDVAREALEKAAGHRNGHSAKIIGTGSADKRLIQKQSGNSSVGRAQPCQESIPVPPARKTTS
jgi:integrase